MSNPDRTTESLLARRALAEKATPGPWKTVFLEEERVVIDRSGTVICHCETDDDFKDEETKASITFNLYHIAASDPSTVMADIDEILRLREEVKKLQKDLNYANKTASEQHEVAKMAWGGEIPSPLPGHRSMTEDEVAAMFEHLNCPWCGGSGHVGDCDEADQQVKARLERLEKEADWLAERLGKMKGCRFAFMGQFSPCDEKCLNDCVSSWRQAARKAVESSHEN